LVASGAAKAALSQQSVRSAKRPKAGIGYRIDPRLFITGMPWIMLQGGLIGLAGNYKQSAKIIKKRGQSRLIIDLSKNI